MRNVVSNVISVASPRISGDPFGFVDSLTVRNVSRTVCSWNVPGVSAVGTAAQVSGGETASDVAVRMPYWSQLRYLQRFYLAR